jgi:hypothetical protein
MTPKSKLSGVYLVSPKGMPISVVRIMLMNMAPLTLQTRSRAVMIMPMMASSGAPESMLPRSA